MADLRLPTVLERDIRSQAFLALSRVTGGGDVSPVLVQWPPFAHASVLPHLAWQFDISGKAGYDFAKTEKEQRSILQRAYRLHALRGTLGGFRAIAKLAGGELVHAVRPPATQYLAPAFTNADRIGFMAPYPELRVYRYQTRSKQTPGTLMLRKAFLTSRKCGFLTDAIARFQPRSFVRRDGVETELLTYEREVIGENKVARQILEIREKGKAGHVGFCGGHPAFLLTSTARARIYTVTQGKAYVDNLDVLTPKIMVPGLEPILQDYEAVAERATRERGVFGQKDFMGFCCVKESTARRRIYRRMHLFDPEIPLRRRGKSMHLNAGRLRMPHHHGEIVVRLFGKLAQKDAWKFVHGFLRPTGAPKAHSDLVAALQTQRRASDKALLNTKTFSVVKSRQVVYPSPTLACGAWVSLF